MPISRVAPWWPAIVNTGSRRRRPASSAGGATLFVKLRQMPAGEMRAVRVDTRDPAAWVGDGNVRVCPQFESAHEHALPLGPGNWLRLRLPDGDRPACRAGQAGLPVHVKHTAAAVRAAAS